jgi:hypothetical protein
MEQYRKPMFFYKKWIVFISKQNFNLEIGFGTGLNAFITFGGTKMNQSIDYVGWKLIRFPQNWFP